MIDQIIITWDEDAQAHHIDMNRNLFFFLFAGDTKKSRRTFVGLVVEIGR